MLEIILGGLAFFLFIIYDLEQARYISQRFHTLTQFFFAFGFLILIFSTINAVYNIMIDSFMLNFSLILFSISAIVCLVLLIYTLFFALPFQETYVSQTGFKIYDKGLYALCRHPGVLWFTGLYISLYLAFGGVLLLKVTLVYCMMNFLYVIIQDKWIFPRIFCDYKEYQQRVPFLLPTKKSVRNCLKTLRK